MGANDEVPLFQTVAYQLNGVKYLPHYRNDSVFVGPSYPQRSNIYTAIELVNAGANKIVMNLWSRGKFGVVDHLNP